MTAISGYVIVIFGSMPCWLHSATISRCHAVYVPGIITPTVVLVTALTERVGAPSVFSESPGLVKPDSAGAPKISPEPPPDSPLAARAGVAGIPSVIIRGDMHTCPN